MKKLILIIGLLVGFVALNAVLAQPPEGSILYEVKINVHRTIPADREEMKQMIPEFNTFQEKLVFKTNESLYKPIEEEGADDFISESGGTNIRLRRPSVEYYFNQEQSKKLRAQEFFGKKYLIEDSVNVLPWKLSNDTRVIQGYTCKLASYVNEERKQNISVWYTDQLKPFLGPENYNTLPGAVLMVDINEGERVIPAKKVELHPLKKADFKVPSGGQKVSEAEFRALVEEQRKRMGSQGGMIIRTN
jgi:GLPGLI family protein